MNKARRDSNPDEPRKRYEIQLRQKYGMTYEQYEKMLWDQKGKCAICGTPASREPFGRLCVDHDHATGVVRALLCRGCNAGLGQFEDNIGRLEGAVQYLKHHHT